MELASVHTGLSHGRPVRIGGSLGNGPDLEHVQIGLPFMPLYQMPSGAWRMWCPRLGRDGRCTDYENRPALCRGYVAGEDPVCDIAPA